MTLLGNLIQLCLSSRSCWQACRSRVRTSPSWSQTWSWRLWGRSKSWRLSVKTSCPRDYPRSDVWPPTCPSAEVPWAGRTLSAQCSLWCTLPRLWFIPPPNTRRHCGETPCCSCSGPFKKIWRPYPEHLSTTSVMDMWTHSFRYCNILIILYCNTSHFLAENVKDVFYWVVLYNQNDCSDNVFGYDQMMIWSNHIERRMWGKEGCEQYPVHVLSIGFRLVPGLQM